jgi:beta-lactamase regulating signal transducer with metallopeptidase domain
MISKIELLQGPAAEALVGTLLHSVWQAALWAMLLVVLLRPLAARRAALRYGLSVACLMCVLLSSLVTWSALRIDTDERRAEAATTIGPQTTGPHTTGPHTTSPHTMGPHAAGVSESKTPEATVHHATNIAPPDQVATNVATAHEKPSTESKNGIAAIWQPVVLLAWATGVVLMLFRLACGLAGTRRLAAGKPIEDEAILSILDEVQRWLGLNGPIRLVASRVMRSPAVIGLFRPTLVMPAALISGLTPADLRAVFAHELAHVRRYDYLVNLAQIVVEALLFFNPAVWWIGRQIRLEREACCDHSACRSRPPLPTVSAMCCSIESGELWRRQAVRPCGYLGPCV